MSADAPAGWYPDPFTRHEHRYWDGRQWTEHVGSAGRQTVDAPIIAPPSRSSPHRATAPTTPTASTIHGQPPVVERVSLSKKVQRQVRDSGVGGAPRAGGGTLLTEHILVVNQKAKLFEKKAEYTVLDQHGRKLGAIRQLGTGTSRLVVGRESATKRFEIIDGDGQTLFTLIKPTSVLKSRVIVMRADGSHVGQIEQDNLGALAPLLGGRFNLRFRMHADGVTLGSINAESWRARDFSIEDAHGAEVARVTKTWEGLSKQMLTTADNYVLEVHRPLEDPLRSLVVSAALAIDTVVHQDPDDRSRDRRRRASRR